MKFLISRFLLLLVDWMPRSSQISFKCCAYCRVFFSFIFLLQHHCNMSLSILLRFARSFNLVRMRSTVSFIDFKFFFYDFADDRQRIAFKIDETLNFMNFIQFLNHDIKQHKINECFQWMNSIIFSCNIFASIILNVDSITNCRANVFSFFQNSKKNQFIHLLHHIIANTRI